MITNQQVFMAHDIYSIAKTPFFYGLVTKIIFGDGYATTRLWVARQEDVQQTSLLSIVNDQHGSTSLCCLEMYTISFGKAISIKMTGAEICKLLIRANYLHDQHLKNAINSVK
jgi:hypothetical protein